VSVLAVLFILGLHLFGGESTPGARRLHALAAIVLPLTAVGVVYAALLRFTGIGGGMLLAQNLIIIPFLIGYGIDDHVYLVHAYTRAPERGVAGALDHEGPPMLLTGLSAVSGFAALLAAGDPGLRILGAAGMAGTLTCLSAAMVLSPAVLAWRRRPRPPGTPVSPGSGHDA
jgi:predicted RND superfamily exporter protein